MSPRQKYIVITLAIANVVAILALVALLTRTLTPSHPHTPTLLPETCQTLPRSAIAWRATQLLAQAGLGGRAALTTGGSLDLKINYPLAPSQTMDDAAQAVWTAFDIALALHEEECPAFTQVTVMVHSNQTNTQINASVNTSDLIAFGANELSQDEFIEHVIFTHSTIHNE